MQNSTCLSMQVNSLRAQANEHRLVKEKLQAAVAAALAGDSAPDQRPVPERPGEHALVGSSRHSSTAQEAVLDLQNAVSSLQVTQNNLYPHRMSLHMSCSNWQ